MRVNEVTQIDFNNAFRYFSNPAAQSYIIYEHNYCIPNDAQKLEDDSRTAVKYLFINPHLQEKLEKSYGDDVVDVESSEDQKVPEMINIMCDGGDENDWTEKIDKKGWNNSKQHIFKSIVEIIEADYLTKLSSEGLPNMIIKQRLMSNKTAIRLRRLFSTISWNAQLLQWVHGLLMDNLPRYLMNIYQDALQYLETKVQPHLMDIILSSNRGRVGNSESQNKKSLDPYLDQLTQKKPAKLVGGPLLIVVPFNTGGGYPANSRQHRWMTEFSHLSTVITLTCTKNNVPTSSMDVNALLDQMVKETRLKIAELRSDYPYKPIVLLGIDSGSAIACHVAMVEKVSAVVCLGFPLLTADGKRGEENDKLLELRTPTLFIIGQNATIASVADMQELRLKLNCKSSLIVVGGTDDNLRSSHYLRMKECITQSVVDRCILIEISLFLNEVLSSPPSSGSSNQQTNSNTTGTDDYKRSSIGSGSLHLKKMLSATPVRRQRIVTQKKNDNDLNMNIGYGLSISNNNDNNAASESPQFSSSSSFSKPLIKADPKLPKPVVPGSQNLYTNMEFIEQNSGGNTGGNSFLSLSTSNVNNLYNKLDVNKSTLPSNSNQPANKRLSNSSVITISTQSGTITIDNTRDRKTDNATRTKRRYVRRIPFEKRRRSTAADPLLHSFPFSNSNSYSQNIKTLNTTPGRVPSSTTTVTSVKPSIVTLTPDSILDLPVVFADDNEVNAAVSNIPGFSS